MNISQELQHGGVLKWWYPKNHRFHFQKGQTLDDLGVPPVYRCSLYHIISITWKSNHLNLAQKSVSAKLQARPSSRGTPRWIADGFLQTSTIPQLVFIIFPQRRAWFDPWNISEIISPIFTHPHPWARCWRVKPLFLRPKVTSQFLVKSIKVYEISQQIPLKIPMESH